MIYDSDQIEHLNCKIMQTNIMNRIPGFDEIVFEIRNKEYGAYRLRKKYSQNVLLGMLIGIVFISTAVITPYLNAKAMENLKIRTGRLVDLKMENLDQPLENVVVPPPPPPPAESIAPVRYIAPLIVDSIKPEDVKQLMTADQAQTEVKNEEVSAVPEIQVEVKEEEVPVEIYIAVEEMPVYPGGDASMLKYINENSVYPEAARENNVQGTVTVRFVVNYKGIVEQVSLIKGVDPALDNEAMRVVKSLPPWKPGKQSGRPVNVAFSVPVKFTLLTGR
jgi:periplasmic protein TonB